jgi:hypothetical protein
MKTRLSLDVEKFTAIQVSGEEKKRSSQIE